MSSISSLQGSSVAMGPARPSKITLSLGRVILITLYAIITLGQNLRTQTAALQTALKKGKIDEAETAIRKGGWWLYEIKSEDIKNSHIESIRLIGRQILGQEREDSTLRLQILRRLSSEKTLSNPQEVSASDITENELDRDTQNYLERFYPEYKEAPPDEFIKPRNAALSLYRFLEKTYQECRKDPNCSPETFIAAVKEEYPDWTKHPKSETPLTIFLRKYYKNKLLDSIPSKLAILPPPSIHRAHRAHPLYFYREMI